jgi:hypothetical protein
MLRQHFESAERHVLDGKGHIARQREIVRQAPGRGQERPSWMIRSARTAVPEWALVEHHLPLVGDGVTVTAHAEVTLSLDTLSREVTPSPVTPQ